MDISSNFSVLGLIPALITSVTPANLLGAIVDSIAAENAKNTEDVEKSGSDSSYADDIAGKEEK